MDTLNLAAEEEARVTAVLEQAHRQQELADAAVKATEVTGNQKLRCGGF